jgi:hypothetical protein
MIKKSDLKSDHRKANKKRFHVGLLSKELCLAGISYEKINKCDGITKNNEIIINPYHTITLGVIFFSISYTWW